MAIIRAGLLAAAFLFLAAATAESIGDMLRAVAAVYYAKAGDVENVTGRDTTMDYYQRLLDDADLLGEPAPSSYPTATWREYVQTVSQLDLSLASQLLRASYQPMAAIRGVGETLVRSSKDGTLQPAALYVPRGYSQVNPAPLVVFLHGRLQAESHLVAAQYITGLAEQTGTIVIAPYGRGAYDFRGSESDVYDAFDAANHAFAIDPRRRYIVGYSMGGFSVFRLAPMHPSDWSAVMSIAGSLLASRAPQVLAVMRNTRFYLVTGARDDNVPTSFPTATATFLRDVGLPVAFYSEPNGTHALYSLRSILARAWTDMERGVVRSPVGLTGSPNLPEALP
ncbi:MAG TPA: alpha/beta hydrolase-fold protein [Candidatus Cybelea sp.]|nr:alpha/beta hydrolase-fold protein [Candidatus Cybelea sp.]